MAHPAAQRAPDSDHLTLVSRVSTHARQHRMQHPTATTHHRHRLGRWRRLCFANHYLPNRHHSTYYPILWIDIGAVISFTELTTEQAENPNSGCLLQARHGNEHSATGTKTNKATTTTTMRCPGRVREHCSHMKERRA